MRRNSSEMIKGPGVRPDPLTNQVPCKDIERLYVEV